MVNKIILKHKGEIMPKCLVCGHLETTNELKNEEHKYEIEFYMSKFHPNTQKVLRNILDIFIEYVNSDTKELHEIIKCVYEIKVRFNDEYSIKEGIVKYIKGKHYIAKKGKSYLFAIIRNTCNIGETKFLHEQDLLDNIPPERNGYEKKQIL